MSRKTCAYRLWHLGLPLLGAALLALLVGFLGLARVDASRSVSLDQDAPSDLLAASEAETYTVYAPVIGRYWTSGERPFGVQTYGSLNGDLGLDEIEAVGARWVRVPFSWGSIEPSNTTPDDYRWSSLDSSVSNAVEKDIQLILTLVGQPSWAATYSSGLVSDTSDIVEFLGAVVERYDADGVDDAPGSPRVNRFELYNEPDNGELGYALSGWGCWGDYDNDVPGCGSAEDYADLLKALHPAMKDASPQAQLVFGGIAMEAYAQDGEGPFDRDFLDTVLAECEGHQCFDVMNFHYYPVFRPNWESYGKDILGKTNNVREKLRAHGFEDVPIVCTEAGWCSNCSWGSDELQSRYVVKLYARSLAGGLDAVTWFRMRDADSDGGRSGLVSDDLEPKDSYWAYQGMTDMLGTAVFQRSLTLTETGDARIEGYVFETPTGRLDVVWTEDDTPYDAGDDPTLPLCVEAESLRVIGKFAGKFGNVTTYNDEVDGTNDGRVTVQVGGSPVYLEYNP